MTHPLDDTAAADVITLPSAPAGGPWPELAMIGALALADHAGIQARGRHDLDTGRPQIDVEGDALAGAVAATARAVLADGALWTRKTANGKRALAAPDWGPIAPAEWDTNAALLREAITDLPPDGLDARLLLGLGRPTHPDQAANPRIGASGWDMSQTARGAEFVAARLLPLAKTLTTRPTDAIAAGLRGDTIDPALTTTGSPRDVLTGWYGRDLDGQVPAVDAAVAWCALHALTMLPTQQCLAGDTEGQPELLPHTAGYVRHTPEQGVLHLPITTTWWTARQWRRVLASPEWAQLIAHAATAAPSSNPVWTATTTALMQLGTDRAIPTDGFERVGALWGELECVAQWDRATGGAVPQLTRFATRRRYVRPEEAAHRRRRRPLEDLAAVSPPNPAPAPAPPLEAWPQVLPLTLIPSVLTTAAPRRATKERAEQLAAVAADAAQAVATAENSACLLIVNTPQTAFAVAEALTRRDGLPIMAVVRTAGLRPLDTPAREAELRARPPEVVIATPDAELEPMIARCEALVAEAQHTHALLERVTAATRTVRVIIPPPPGQDPVLAWLHRRAADPDGLSRAARQADPEPARPAAWLPIPRAGRHLPAGFPTALPTNWIGPADLPAGGPTCSLVVRWPLHDAITPAIELLRATPVDDREVWRIPLRLAQELVNSASTDGFPIFRPSLDWPGESTAPIPAQPDETLIVSGRRHPIRGHLAAGLAVADDTPPQTVWGPDGVDVLFAWDENRRTEFEQAVHDRPAGSRILTGPLEGPSGELLPLAVVVAGQPRGESASSVA